MPNDNFNVNSYNQHGGITAGQVNIGKVPRSLLPPIIQQILGIAAEYKGKKIVVSSAFGDSEAYDFALQIKSLLESNAYTVESMNQKMTVPPLKGQSFGPIDGGVEFLIGSQ